MSEHSHHQCALTGWRHSHEREVLQLLEAALAFAPRRVPDARFRVEWNEPDKGPVSEAVQRLQSEYQDSPS